ncbi:MAG: Trk system potassium transporter TrkA [Rhodothermales bacterium]|nr:Trk system potassium transporter TrkA [Rhodothermales bacterium]
MRVIVVGSGEVGFDVARILSMEQHDVVVVDIDSEALANCSDKLDVLTIHGNGTSASILDQAGIKQADLMVAVAAIDEVNIIACMMASRLGVKTTVARVRSDELATSDTVLNARDFGIDLLIHPEESAAAEVVRLIRRASATDLLTFADGRLQLVGMRINKDSPAVGKSLAELDQELPSLLYRVTAISRGIRTIIPGGSDVIRANDQIFVLTRPKEISAVLKQMGKSDSKLHQVMILGGNEIGARVASALAGEKNKRVKLIEPDREHAEHLAETLPNVLVLHGQGTDIDLLATEGLGEMDAFVAVTDDEESNLVTCLLAKHLGVKKTVALLSKGAYIPISQTIGLDAAVSSKLAVSREILQYLRGKHVMSVATLHGLDAEILEIEVQPRAPITHGPIMELKVPKGLIIGAIITSKKATIAAGKSELHAGDRAIVFVMPKHIKQAESLFNSP